MEARREGLAQKIEEVRGFELDQESNDSFNCEQASDLSVRNATSHAERGNNNSRLNVGTFNTKLIVKMLQFNPRCLITRLIFVCT